MNEQLPDRLEAPRPTILRVLARLGVMVVAVVIGHALGGIVGVVIGACLATVVITQTEDVVRLLRRSADVGGSSLQVGLRATRAFFGHSFVQRLTRNVVIALGVAIATAVGSVLGGQIGAVIGAALSVGLGQTLVQLHPQPAAPMPINEPKPEEPEGDELA